MELLSLLLLAQICEALLDHCLAPDCRMGGVGCDNMSVVLACFLRRESYRDLVHRCSIDSNKVSKTRRFSSMGSMDYPGRLGAKDRRLSEPPPPITKSPVIPSNLKEVSDKASNGWTDSVLPDESGGESRGEGVREAEQEDSEFFASLGTTL